MSDAQLAQDVALDARSYLETLEAVAAGEAGDQSISLLLLDVARICQAGAQLGALTDIILESNVEPIVEALPDVDELRSGLAVEFDPVDEYLEVFDPYVDEPPVPYRLSDDLTEIAGDLMHGLRHFDAGRQQEALCGGGSSPTSTTGETTPAPHCVRCRRSSLTCDLMPSPRSRSTSASDGATGRCCQAIR